VLAKAKSGLAQRGVASIAAIGRAFRNFDSFNGDKKLSKDEFFYGLQDYGVELTKAECNALHAHFDKDGDGTVNYDEFLVGIRGSMNEARSAIVQKAFEKMDKDGSGNITIDDMKGVYSANQHKKVISGEKTEEEIFLEFLQRMGDKNADGQITKKEWFDYYAALSSNVDNDEEFVLIITNAWKL
jgi:Ca2+-binding EF-hand superfamily protein